VFDVSEEEKQLKYLNDSLCRDGANLRAKINISEMDGTANGNGGNDERCDNGDAKKQTNCYVSNKIASTDTQMDREIINMRCIPSPPGAFIAKANSVGTIIFHLNNSRIIFSSSRIVRHRDRCDNIGIHEIICSTYK
jgi:hypothetical protein